MRSLRICGDPGSETDSFCTGQASKDAEKVGWTSYDRTLYLCDGRLSENPAGWTCTNDLDMARVSTDRLSLSDEDRGWLVACTARL